jgi:hypothetical protein
VLPHVERVQGVEQGVVRRLMLNQVVSMILSPLSLLENYVVQEPTRSLIQNLIQNLPQSQFDCLKSLERSWFH